MAKTTSMPARKPASAEGEQRGPRCYCNHHQAAHPCSDKCDCRVFTPRPCKCGHHHSGRCAECKCTRFREDPSPELILRLGLHSGDWQTTPLPRLRALMRPGVQLKVRVYACCLIHSGDYRLGRRNQGRLVRKPTADGETAPLQPRDILLELNSFDPDGLGRVTKQNLRSCLRELEADGWIRQVGRVKGNVRILLYAKPLARRELPGEPELVGFGSEISLPNPAIPNNPEEIHEKVILPIRRTVVKTFMRQLRLVAGNDSDLVGKSHYQKALDEAVAKIDLVVESAYQKMLLVGKKAPQTEAAYTIGTRARNSISSKEEPAPAASSSEEQSRTRPVPAIRKDKSSAGGRACTGLVEEPPARPPVVSKTQPTTPQWRLELREFMKTLPLGTHLDEPMFQRIAAHLTESLLPQFKTEASRAAARIRKWAGYEAIAKQVAERGLVIPDRPWSCPKCGYDRLNKFGNCASCGRNPAMSGLP